MKHSLYAALLLCAATGISATAAEPVMLDGMVITATRTLEDVQRVPAAVTVITKEDLDKRPVQNIADALAHTTGAYRAPVADGSLGSDFSVRGFGSTDILVMIDGQPVNSGWNGSVDWQMLPTTGIERIELVKGAASSLYGGRAVGAVMNIITEGHKDGFDGNIRLSYGSNGTKRGAFDLRGDINGRWTVGLGYERRSTDGYPSYYFDTKKDKTAGTPNAFGELAQSARYRYIYGSPGDKHNETDIAKLQVGYRFDDDRSLNYRFTHSRHTYGYRNPISLLRDKDGRPVFNGTVAVPGGTVTVEPGDFLHYSGEYVMDIHRLQFTDTAHKVYATLGYTHRDKDGYSTPGDVPADLPADQLNDWNGPGVYSFYPSESYDFNIYKEWETEQHSIVAGYNFRRESFAQTRYDSEQWRDHKHGLSPYEYNGGKGTTHAFYLQDQYQVDDRLTVYAGLRWDRYTKSDGYSHKLSKGKWIENSYSSGTYTQLSPKLAAEYSLTPNSTAYVSYGKAFNPPVLYQVYRNSGSTKPNPNLGPERTTSVEAGWKWHNDATAIDIGIFRARTTGSAYRATRNGVTAYYNFDNPITRRGLEFSVKQQLSDDWSGYVNYTLQRADDDGDKIYGIPRHLLHFGVEYDRQPWNILIDSTYVSERQSPDELTGTLRSDDAFFLTDLSLRYALTPEVTLQGAVTNLFDRQFYAVEAARGRAYTVSMQYQF